MLREIVADCREDLSLLLEVGIILIELRNDRDASKLITASKLIAPESNVPDLCLAHFLMQKMQFQAASKLLDQIINQEPDNILALSMMGICLSFFSETQQIGKEMIELAISKTNDKNVLDVCQIASKWIRTDHRFKNEKSIFIPQSEK